MAPAPVIAVHGGAADYRRASVGATWVAEALDAVADALRVGQRVLRDGGSALDAVVAAVRVLEDAPRLNAGRGGALTTDGVAELDAAVMDGRDRAAGAVAGVRTTRHPVEAALAVLRDGHHVLLAGPAADTFAAAGGCEQVDPSWFVTDHQRRRLADVLAGGRDATSPETPKGTVGAVALDRHGHLAAATSTGGITGQAPGRVGDTPVIGAGTWADDATVAVSATGAGEAFLRASFAATVHHRVAIAGEDVATACDAALADVGRFRGATGGCVAVARDGTVTMPFTADAMFRGYALADGDGDGVVVAAEPGEELRR